MTIVTGGEGQSGSENGQQTGNLNQKIEVEINGEKKTLTVEEVKVLAGKVGELERAKEGYAPFAKVLLQYGVDVNDYLRNSEASFAVVNQLIEKGIIDDQGNVLEKKAEEDNKGNIIKQDDSQRNTSGGKATKTILDALTKIAGRIESLEEGQSGIYRRNIEADVKSKYPDLESGDITQILARAKADRGRDFWDHAKTVATDKAGRIREQRQNSARETIGILIKAGVIPEGKIDLEKLDLDALKGVDVNKLPPVQDGKTFIFSSRLRKMKGAGIKTDSFSEPSAGMKELLERRKEY